jgi:hypothetical protein
MNAYPVVVFVHVIAAMGLFAAMAIEAVSRGMMRRADTPAFARIAMAQGAVPARLGPISMLTVLASGIWMMAVSWGSEPWIVAAFLGLVAMGAAGGAVTGRRMRSLRAALAAETGPVLSDGFRAIRSSRALTVSFRLRTALLIGIVILMTVKPPGTGTASLVLVAAALAGLVAGLVPPASSGSRRATEA